MSAPIIPLDQIWSDMICIVYELQDYSIAICWFCHECQVRDNYFYLYTMPSKATCICKIARQISSWISVHMGIGDRLIVKVFKKILIELLIILWVLILYIMFTYFCSPFYLFVVWELHQEVLQVSQHRGSVLPGEGVLQDWQAEGMQTGSAQGGISCFLYYLFIIVFSQNCISDVAKPILVPGNVTVEGCGVIHQ